MTLEARIADRSGHIVVIGCGYVGLPLALAFAGSGFHVTGLDTSSEKVERLLAGKSYLMDISDKQLCTALQSGRFTATIDSAVLARADVIFVCVPTPFDRAKAPDLTYVRAAAGAIASHLRPGQLILLESTTYPGTTEEVLLPILERTGLRAGHDFWLAFSPERIDPGNRTATIANTPKVVGGIDDRSTDLAASVLAQIIAETKIHRVSSPRVAEMTKLLENVFRSVNIALVNELAQLCDRMGIDIWEVVDAASTKPYGFMPFYPGPGVGGHCIPVDPYYLSWKAREYDFSTKFIELAAETNAQMPFFTVDKLRRALQQIGKLLPETRLLVIGAAFKRDIDDSRNSPAIRTIEILAREGVDIQFHDPHVPVIRFNGDLYRDGESRSLGSVELTSDAIAAADAVLILVAHSAVDYDLVARHASFVFDAVNAMRGRDLKDGTLVRL